MCLEMLTWSMKGHCLTCEVPCQPQELYQPGAIRRAEIAVGIQNRKSSIPRVGYTADEIVEMQIAWDGEACHKFATEEAAEGQVT